MPQSQNALAVSPKSFFQAPSNPTFPKPADRASVGALQPNCVSPPMPRRCPQKRSLVLVKRRRHFIISRSERYVFIAHIFSFRRRQTVVRCSSRIWFPLLAVLCSAIYAIYVLDAKAAIFRRAWRFLPALAAILIPASVLSKKSAMLSRSVSEPISLCFFALVSTRISV
jgi:hypothetical protein